jgi:hypothetical protein
VYHLYDSSKTDEVSPDHEKCHADHFSQQPRSGALQVCSSGEEVNFIFYIGVLKEYRDAT